MFEKAQAMKSKDFIITYWSQFISLEKEFTSTIHFLALDPINEKSYSQAYSKLLLEIGSEVDVVFKEYCMLIDTSFKSNYTKINRYKESINNCNPNFKDQILSVKNINITLQPWVDWKKLDAPYWWTAYNKVKHFRTRVVEIDGNEQEGYKFANQKYTLLALAGLYQVMINYYEILAKKESKSIIRPLPESRLFELLDDSVNPIEYTGNIAIQFDPDTKSIKLETGLIYY